MFYQELRRLRDYGIPELFIRKLKDILSSIPTERVSPILIAKKLGVSHDEAFRICEAMVKEGLASIRYEIVCPECSADVDIVDDIKNLPNEQVTCDVCGERFLPSADDIWVVLYFRWEQQRRGQEASLSEPITLRMAYEIASFAHAIDEKLFKIDRKMLKELLDKVLSADTNKEKKESLEDLAEYLFSSITGIKVIDRNARTKTSEIDLILELDNIIFSFHPFFKEVGQHIMIECKNWEKAIGADEVRSFSSDMSDKRVTFGCMVTRKGITRDAYEEIRKKFRTDHQVIIVLSREDVERVIKGENLIELLKEKYRRIKFEM